MPALTPGPPAERDATRRPAYVPEQDAPTPHPAPPDPSAPSRPVLILGGTAEARALAAALVGAGVRVVSSLAGRVRDPALPAGEVRIGGFGGVDGLVAWIDAHDVDAVVDATHPFASTMTAHAVAACAATGVPLVVLRRPGWAPQPGWVWAGSLADAAARLPALGERVFLTTGRTSLATFAGLDLEFLIRCVDPPSGSLPRRATVLLDRGPFTVAGERALLREHRIDVLVTKDSGGPLTAAKLAAAREEGVRVLVVRRPPLPSGVDAVPTADAALAALTRRDRRPGAFSADRGAVDTPER